jgi:uncharacterized damage-inducible protein DinB
MSSLRITTLPGFTPTVGRLVCMMTYARETLLQSVQGLSREDLDHLHDGRSNSIGALLAHIAAVERWYQILTFEDREPSPDETAPWLPALDLGESAREKIRERDLKSYLSDLARTRKATLAALADRTDDWLEAPLPVAPKMNAHWAWFHVAEDEVNHRGQIRWLRARLPSTTQR